MKTEQEEFWAGRFGNEYSDRNVGEQRLAANIALFAKVFSRADHVESVLEFGCNIGLNLRAIRSVCPTAKLVGVEINEQACEVAKEINGPLEVHRGSILEYDNSTSCDMSISKGLLIHISPDHLKTAYKALFNAANRYIMICEYFNPSPVEVEYRGFSDRLFKRDFAGEMMDLYPDLMLLDYGFCYSRDAHFPQDNMTWFLLEKS